MKTLQNIRLERKDGKHLEFSQQNHQRTKRKESISRIRDEKHPSSAEYCWHRFCRAESREAIDHGAIQDSQN